MTKVKSALPTAAVLRLVPRRAQVISDNDAADVLVTLRELVRMAERGELRGFAFAALLRENHFLVDVAGIAADDPRPPGSINSAINSCRRRPRNDARLRRR